MHSGPFHPILNNANKTGWTLCRLFFHKYLLVGLLIILSCTDVLKAQFYSGLNMSFGKNRVQFDDRLWTFYPFQKFDTYFYLNGRQIAIYTAEYATKRIDELEKMLDYQLQVKIQFVIFNNLSELKESNIGLTADAEYNRGGITHIVDSKVFIYFNDSYHDLEKQINAGIAQVMINQIMYGEGVTARVINSALVNLPEWFEKGLVSFIARPWDTQIDNIIRDSFLSGKYARFNRLTGEEARYAGHSIWYYISETYGTQAIVNLIHTARLSRRVENSFNYVLGLNFKELTENWNTFYQEMYGESPESFITHDLSSAIVKTKRSQIITQMELSPAGNKIAWVVNDMGKHRLLIRDLNTGKTQTILKRGHRLEEKTDYSQPLIAWHPSGQILTIITEQKGGIWIWYYWLDTKEINKLELFHFEKVLSFSYAPDGQNIVVSALRNGQTNIFVYNVPANTFQNITRDGYTDLYPSFINSGREIIFSSDRPDTNLENTSAGVSTQRSGAFNLFSVNYSRSSANLRRITISSAANHTQAKELSTGKYIFLNDENGITNRYLANLDSTISHIDTIVHYRYRVSTQPLTNYHRNIVHYGFDKESFQVADIIIENGTYYVYKNPLETDIINPDSIIYTYYARQRQLALERGQSLPMVFSLRRASPRGQAIPAANRRPVSEIDINNYIFGLPGDFKPPVRDTLGEVNKRFTLPILRNYNVEFSLNQLVNQLDFGYLNQTYQVFQGGQSPVYINPGLNALFKIGAMDMMEDYRLTAGVKISPELTNNEYLLSFENLKRRLNKQVIFHRMALDTRQGRSMIRSYAHSLNYLVSWPFSNVLALKGGAAVRQDQHVFLASDYTNLQKRNEYDFWAGVKSELVFDNTRNPATNIYFGSRWKIFAEHYRRINNFDQSIYIVGFDFRYYLPIHRNLIWANRIGGSTSFGRELLVYYLGGVDTWLAPRFNEDIEVDQSQNYAWQTLATNMRGAYQNTRNGNSFAVLNSEIRFPVFSYLLNRPIRNQFIKDFQIVGFADIGSAWKGLNPYSDENAFINREIKQPGSPMTITLVNQKEPFVAGFGTGLRTSLLGYFIRADYAWLWDDGMILPPVFYISFSLDF